MEIETAKKLIDQNWEEFLALLDTVLKIPSVKGEAVAGAPFGLEPRKALNTVLKIAQDYGFVTETVHDAVGYAQWGEENQNYIGILGHLDVVPAGEGWNYPPFALSEKDGRLYGRGVLDNKGPILSCLFALKLLKDAGVSLTKTVRIMFGTDEESGSQDIPLYLQEEQPPIFGFTPDCKYPVVYGERGIVNVEIVTPFSKEILASIGEFEGDQARDHVPDELTLQVGNEKVTVKGKRSPSNAPELGVNAIPLLGEKLLAEKLVNGELAAYFHWLVSAFKDQHYGEGLALELSDPDSGQLILTPYELQKTSEGLSLGVAFRYPVTYTEKEVLDRLEKHIFPGSQVVVVRSIPSVIFEKNRPEIRQLSKIYQEVTGLDGTPVTTTGATYARSMPNILAFGPSFPGQKGIAHNQDEYMDVVDLKKNMLIYLLAIETLGA